MHVYTFCRIFHFQNFAQPPSSRPSCCTSHKLSPRELNFCVPCVLNVHEKYSQYSKHKNMCICSKILFFGYFSQPKCDGFLEWMNSFLYRTLERNGHQKVRANFLARQLQSCLALRTRNKN